MSSSLFTHVDIRRVYFVIVSYHKLSGTENIVITMSTFFCLAERKDRFIGAQLPFQFLNNVYTEKF
jgi:hypothetical protein